MIDVKDLRKNYGPLAAVRDVTFHVSQGEIIGFLGPNGAGKTTTMRMLTGFSPPTAGTAAVAGFDIARQPLEVKRRVGYMPESVPLYPEMPVAKFLAHVAAVKGVPRRAVRTEVGRVAERCGLAGVVNRLIRHLSKGYRQRVGLAQALVGDPPVLILDEPTVGLDPAQIVEIRQMIRDLAEGHTVLLSTHILPEVAMVCERVLIIHRGRLVAQDTMEALTASGQAAVLEVVLETPDPRAQTVLAAIEDVSAVQPFPEDATRYRIEASPGTALAGAASAALTGAGIGFTALQPRRRTLEEVFLEAITTEEEAPA